MSSEGAGLYTVRVFGLHEAKTQSPVRANKTGTHCASTNVVVDILCYAVELQNFRTSSTRIIPPS